jgi:hypothetical protein
LCIIATVSDGGDFEEVCGVQIDAEVRETGIVSGGPVHGNRRGMDFLEAVAAFEGKTTTLGEGNGELKKKKLAPNRGR